MKVLKSRVDWGAPPILGVHFGRPPQLHVLVDSLPSGDWVYSASYGANYRRFYFAEQGGEARFLRQGPDGLVEPWGRVSLRMQDESTVELDPRPLDPSTINYLAYKGESGFQQVVPVVLYYPVDKVPMCQGPHYVILDFAREAAAKCKPPVFLAQERFGWDDSSWRWVPSMAEDRPVLPGELLEGKQEEVSNGDR